MRLLELDESDGLRLSSHDADNIPPYAILSHTWGPDADELTLQDVTNKCYREKAGFSKARFCGEQAKRDGLQYFWIDSCCIDKTSSSELSEAIISMFRWYKRAVRCYVYLQDVSTRKRDLSGQLGNHWEAAFRKSRWFTRGWTLQELLAPATVAFYSRDGDLLGDKASLENLITAMTGIPLQALRGAALGDFSPNERLRWAMERETKRKEDMAYCLLGIFSIILQPMYGEEENAFARLEKAIGERWSQLEPRIIARCLSRTEKPPQESVSSAVSAREMAMESLGFDRMDARHDDIRNAQRTTCEWLIKHPTYTLWNDSKDRSRERAILWLNGKPGAGKSTLMKFALGHAKRKRKSENGILISFFFNARGEQLEKTTIGMYRSLLWQLFQNAPDIQSILVEVSSQSSCWTLDTLQTLFTTAVACLGERSLTCFVDALDECNEQQVRDMVSQFEDLAESACEGGTRLRVCFASRHYPTIRVRKGLSMILENEDGHGEDLRKFIRQRLDVDDGEEADRVRLKIHQKSNGVFMWAIVVIEILNAEYRKGRIWHVERKLEGLPEKLGDIFRGILRHDRADMDELLLCLQWILFSRRPLKLEEFYFAMATGYGDTQPQPWRPQTVTRDHMVRFVVSSSKGLAEPTQSDNPIVQFIHESVRDFLLKDGGLCELWPHLGGKVTASSNDQLKQCCYKHITLDYSGLIRHGKPLPKASSATMKELRETASIKFPFLEYAVQNVLYHADKAAQEISQHTFLNSFPFAAWIRCKDFFQPRGSRRHGPKTTLLYILAESNFASLIDTVSKEQQWTRSPGERYGWPFLVSFVNGHREAIESLWEQCGPVSVKDVLKEPRFGIARRVVLSDDPFAWALKHKSYILAGYLWATCGGADAILADPKNSDKRRSDLLKLAAGHSTVREVKKLFKLLHRDSDSDSGAVKSSRDRSLFFAARRDNKGVVQYLLEKGADPNAQGPRYDHDVEGTAVLQVAILEGREETVELLIEAGADVNAQGGEYGNALQAAAWRGTDKILEILINAGADANAQGGEYGNALQAASFGGETVLVPMLLRAGADVNARGGKYGNALQAAARAAKDQIAETLINAGGDVNAQGGLYGNALQAAAWRGPGKIAEMLINAGADVNAQGGLYGSALQAASIRGHERLVQILIDAGGDINAHGGPHGNALQAASFQGYEKIAQILIGAGGDVNAAGGEYGSALQAAARCVPGTGRKWMGIAEFEGHEKVVQILIDAGANVNARGGIDGSVLQAALRGGNQKIIRMLRDAGATEYY